jgi:AraC-like DNA-binding protein
MASDAHFKKEMVNALISAGLYHVLSVWFKSLTQNPPQNHAPSSRSRVIYENFLKLVTEYHTQYRNVGFYADKLSLTPKYLSKLVKNESGRSAPEWIDAYVILEAKNLLKHSNIAIKEIVYKLNFPNQSVFYKFFKMRTGMTPSEYRNS